MARHPKTPKDDDQEITEFGAEVDAVDDADEPESKVLAAASLSADLTEQEKIELEAEARAEVALAMKKSKMKAFKAAAKKRLQAEAMFSEGKDETGKDLVVVDLQMASHPKWIMLDGKRFHSGRSYRVRKEVASVLLDQMDRGWRQEEARLGEKKEFFRDTRKTLGADNKYIETVVH